jgi:glycosyltransferase involved in cell wall biosynthesis
VSRKRVAIVGPVYPYRAGIAYCTTALAEHLSGRYDVDVISFKRQYPRWFYPGGNDVDETLRDRTPPGARFVLDILNPLTWLGAARQLRRSRPDAVIVVWWIWVWAIPYWLLLRSLDACVIVQCHNVGEKEPARWKRRLADLILRRGNVLVVHAKSEADDARSRVDTPIVQTFLPVHEMGGAIPSREEARRKLNISAPNMALFFGHIRPFKGLDIALRAWPMLRSDVILLVAGEAWWKSEEEYRRLASENAVFDLRFIPDSEIATYFAAADVVLAPYRTEAQSGVALTAFHFGRPVIATTVGGLPEIIEDGRNGLLVPPEDPVALAAAVDRFFGSDQRKAMEDGAARSARRYSWEEYATLFAGLVEQCSTPGDSKSASS